MIYKYLRISGASVAALAFTLFLVLVAGATAQKVPAGWLTKAESSGYLETPRYEDTIAFARKLANSSRLIEYRSIGKSPEGRDIPLLVLAEGGAAPDTASRSRKPVILIQAAIHSGESDGKDAGLALLRDIAILGMHDDIVSEAVILFIPILNVDGHELWSRTNRINQNGPDNTGFRANSANQNLNRDYIKADTPEIRAWLSLWNLWNPDLFIDCHVTDGADYRFNITWEYARHGEAPLQIRDWMKRHFEEEAVPSTEAKGNLLSPYIQLADRNDPTKGMYSFIATPRYATGYSPLRNRAGLLIEAHSLKDYGNRVRGTYDLLLEMIRTAVKNRETLKAANAEADRAARDLSGREFPLRLQIERKPTRQFLFKGVTIGMEDSRVSGTKKTVYGSEPVDAEIPWFDTATHSATVTPPDYYLVPPQWIDVVDRIRVHALKFEVLEEDTEILVEGYRLEDPKWASGPFEGRITVSATAIPIRETRRFPKGTLAVPVGQPAGAVAIHMLEPDGPDSLFYWGFFNSIFERKEYAETYMLEKLAEQMLAADPGLRSEFEERLKDEAFAKNPRARLDFFYERSGFKEVTGVYPIGRVSKDELRKVRG